VVTFRVFSPVSRDITTAPLASVFYSNQYLLEGLRKAVLGFTNGPVGPSEISHFVRLCHSLAESQLLSRRIAFILSKIHDLDSSDLAFDCIAELFQRDSAGRYLQLATYFSSFPLDQLSDQEILVHLRRLISSKVHQGIFRLLNEADPSLGKILRNIKLAIGSLQFFEEVERFGETFIVPSLCDSLELLPALTQEEIERAILESTSGAEFIPELLSRFAAYLRSQSERRRVVPLIGVALAVRGAYTARAALPSEATDPHDIALTYDADALVRMTMQDLRVRGGKLLSKGKVTAPLFEAYMKVIEEGLSRRFLELNGEDFTLFGALKSIRPALTKEQYRKAHRSRLEYLARIANQITANRMKRGK